MTELRRQEGWAERKKISASIYRDFVKGWIRLAKRLEWRGLGEFWGEMTKIEELGKVKISS